MFRLSGPLCRDQRRSHRRHHQRFLLGVQVSTNSFPVPLTPGTWYLAVYNVNTNDPITYQVVANYITSGGLTIIPLANAFQPAAAASSRPCPDQFLFLHRHQPRRHRGAIWGEQHERQRGFDRAQRGLAHAPADDRRELQPRYHSGTDHHCHQHPLPSLTNTTWYLGVPNNTAQAVTFLVTATTLTNAPPGTTTPAVVLTGMSLGTNGFTLQWTAAPGTQYEVDATSDLVHWTNAAVVTPSGSLGAYHDPTSVSHSAARFYQVRTR